MVAADLTLGVPDDPADLVGLGAYHDRTAAEAPDRTAVIDGATGDRITYGEFAANVSRAGNALADLGVDRGDRVCVFSPNEVEFLYAFLGAARLGAVPVPVNIQVVDDTIEAIVADSGARLAVSSVADEALESVRTAAARVDGLHRVAAMADDAPSIEGAEAISLREVMADASASLEPAAVAPDDPAMQPYTSGSTGRPKGVVLSHGNVFWTTTNIHAVHFLDASDRAVVAGPLYHKNAMAGAVKPMLKVGGSVVVMPGFEPADVIAAIDTYGVTYIRGVPAMYKMLVNATDALSTHDVSSIEWAVSGSASLPEALIEQVRETFGCPMGEAYGLTETGGPVTLSPRWGPKKLGSSGLVLPGGDIRIVDPDTLEELPAGEVGELVISCPGNGRYFERPGKEAEAFFERDGRRFLRTDDLARQDDQGYHYIVGRLDDMMIVGGENVYPAEVEGLLLKHDAVSDVAVVAAPHATKGEAPVAFVVTDGSVTEDDLKQYTIEHGPAYAHPRRVFFKDSLDLAGTGKIDRQALADEAGERIDGAL